MPITNTITTYNTVEAAQRLKVTRVTIWRAMRDGKLAFSKRGQSVVITSEDLLEYVLRYQFGRGIPGA
jgi:excisionase family DNA binding protein